MSEVTNNAPQLSRRGLLKVGLVGAVLLAGAGAGASLLGVASKTPAAGFSILRASDLPGLRAICGAVLHGAVEAQHLPAAIDSTLQGLDYNLSYLSPEMLKLTQQLFDVLAMGLTRGPLTGVWGSWEGASYEQVEQFLQRWEHSSLSLLQMGHASLIQLVLMAWYGRPQSWAQCGYPGPPAI